MIGFSQSQAMETLRQAGFYVAVTMQTSTQPVGTVIYESPAAGTEAFQTDTVTITVAKEPASSP